MNPLRSRIRLWWQAADARQRIGVPAGIAVTLMATIAVVVWCARPDEELLFSGISPEEVGPIVEELSSAGVRSRVEGSGRIWVEPARVDEMRMRIASRGLIGNHTLGYEILDTDPGTTDFLQHEHTRRALEGELTRTIESLAEVSTARVHLAIPEKSADETLERKPRASIVLALRPGAPLANDQARGIRALVSASVAGLGPEDVAVLDASGRMLTDSSGDLGQTFEQLRMQQQVEAYLRDKARAMLEPVVGASAAIVQVTAGLNFDRVEREVEVYNPATTSLRSEQKSAGSKDSDETVLTQYEIDKTTERILGETGTIQRLSIAVLVNGIETKGPGGRTTYVERSLDELDQLAAIVRSAVGFSSERGDVLEIANLRFAKPVDEEAAGALPRWLFFHSIDTHLQSFILLLSIGLVAWGLRQASLLLVRAIEDDRRRRENALALDTNVASPKPLTRQVLKERMHELACDRPNEVASLLRGWIADERLP